MADQEISGRVVLVTGGSRGIGRAVSIGLGRSGARVAVNYAKDEAAAHATLEEIEAVGGSGGIYPGDVSTRVILPSRSTAAWPTGKCSSRQSVDSGWGWAVS